MSAEDNIANTKAAYAAFAAGDAEAAQAALADDVEWIVPGNSTLSGTYVGKEAIMGLWMKLLEKGFTTTPVDYFANENRVVVLTTTTAAGETGEAADVITFSGDQVVSFTSYGDTALQERIWGAK